MIEQAPDYPYILAEKDSARQTTYGADGKAITKNEPVTAYLHITPHHATQEHIQNVRISWDRFLDFDFKGLDKLIDPATGKLKAYGQLAAFISKNYKAEFKDYAEKKAAAEAAAVEPAAEVAPVVEAAKPASPKKAEK